MPSSVRPPVSVPLVTLVSSKVGLGDSRGASLLNTSGVGAPVGEFVGAPVGDFVGAPVGDFVGTPVGDFVGAPVGDFVGDLVGDFVGDPVGEFVGAEGRTKGTLVAESLFTVPPPTPCIIVISS